MITICNNTPMSTPNDMPALLRSHGLRVTPQRLAVADLILSESMHATARMVHEQLRQRHPAISLNTIYLTLGQFEASSLLNRFEVNGNTVFDSNTAPHDHACCRECGKIIDLASSPLPQHELPTALRQWRIESESYLWLGLCQTCHRENNDS